MSDFARRHGQVEPWLRGSRTGTPPLQRAVLHALDLAREDMERWALALSDEELAVRPFGLPSVGFQVRHIARSLDRLLTYAAGSPLSEAQLAMLQSEESETASQAALSAEFGAAIEMASNRVSAYTVQQLQEERQVGRAGLPTTVAGLLVHVAEHSQRHVGQAITTAKIVQALRSSQQS